MDPRRRREPRARRSGRGPAGRTRPRGQLWREGPGVSPEPELVRLNTALTRLAEQLKPALVQIRVQRQTEEPDPEEGPRRALGSGFVIHPERVRRDERARRRALDVRPGAARVGPAAPRHRRRAGPARRSGAGQDRSRRVAAGAAPRRLRAARGRGARAGARPPVRARADRVARDREPEGRAAPGVGPGVRLHPDRRGREPRQLGRARWSTWAARSSASTRWPRATARSGSPSRST